MISRLPLNVFAVLIAFFSFIPSKYFAWAVALMIAISVGLYRKRMIPADSSAATLRGIATILLFAAPIALIPVVLWGPYSLQGYLIDQSSAVVIGLILMSLSVLDFIMDKRTD